MRSGAPIPDAPQPGTIAFLDDDMPRRIVADKMFDLLDEIRARYAAGECAAYGSDGRFTIDDMMSDIEDVIDEVRALKPKRSRRK